MSSSESGSTEGVQPSVDPMSEVRTIEPDGGLQLQDVITDANPDEAYLRRRKKYEKLAEMSAVDQHLSKIEEFERQQHGHHHSHHDHHDHDGIPHPHNHYSSRSNGLRAAVLGANDGLVSVASLIFGVIAGDLTHDALVIAAVAGLIGGAISMGIGELISVYSARDSEEADIQQEKRAHFEMGEVYEAFELAELTKIYERKGLSRELAKQVAIELSARDVLQAHLVDELGIDADELSNPWQACFYSMASFVAGAILPVIVCIVVEEQTPLIIAMCFVSTFVLLATGYVSGKLSGASITKAIVRIVGGGWAAMIVTFGITYAVSLGFTRK